VAGKCDICGKTTQFGRNVSFSKRRTNRRFKPNVQPRTIVVDGVTRRVNICTSCLRTSVKSA
jgi:large subunit ribosomal protein L28